MRIKQEKKIVIVIETEHPVCSKMAA